MAPDRIISLKVEEPASRLDQYLAKMLPDISRSKLKKLIQQEKVLIADLPAKVSAGVQPGDVIVIHLPENESTSLAAEAIPLDIIFADDDMIVVNKPAGMVVHPAHGHAAGTLVNALLARYPDLAALTKPGSESELRPGIVHRLDQDTSGLIIVARTPASLKDLQQQFKARRVEKTYLALVFGQPQAPEGVIEVPIGRDPRHRQRMAPQTRGKAARTWYRISRLFMKYSLLEIGLETGRTHQIRVHLAWLKCPVVGDTVYGRKTNQLGLTRQFLHAWRLKLQHPRHHSQLEFETPLDPQLQQVLDQLQ